MYVDGMTLSEAVMMRDLLRRQLQMSKDIGDGAEEQIRWDLEDVQGRLDELLDELNNGGET